MGSAHLKGGSLGNPRPPLSINKEPISFEKELLDPRLVHSSADLSLVTRPTSPHSTNESSLDRRVLTRPTSPHSTDESSLDQRVLTRPFSSSRLHPVHAELEPDGDDDSLVARSLSSLGADLVTQSTNHHSTDESSLDRRVLTRLTSPHSTDESSLDRRVLTRSTSPHLTDESSLDCAVSLGSISRGHSLALTVTVI
ncbi:hypothetical protein YC2023_090154 [Brassica napus]